MIYYCCPDLEYLSSGVRLLYRHVEVLLSRGIDAAILHDQVGFRYKDSSDVPVYWRKSDRVLDGSDIVVIPEGVASIMAEMQARAVRRVIIALNWHYIYNALEDAVDWRNYGVERAISNSPFIAEMVNWAMGIPCDVFRWGINDKLYYTEPVKSRRIVYIERKKGCVRHLMRLLWSRNPKFVQQIEWVALDGLSESDYARAIRESAVFLTLSMFEGLPASSLEAMRSGTIVVGFNGVGGQRELIGQGENQNCVIADNNDYVTLAQRITPLLEDMLRGDVTRWTGICNIGIKTSAAYTREAETQSILSIWNNILGASK
jgi:glycosyltransferase involved in cell wall biosynthesis